MATAWNCSCQLFLSLLQAACSAKAGTSILAFLVSLSPSLSMQCILALCLQEPSFLVPMFPGHLYRLYTRFFSHHSMFFSNSVKLDLLNYFPYMTSVENWLQIRAFFPIADINSDNCAFNSASRCYHSGNAWKSTSLCLMRKTSFLTPMQATHEAHIILNSLLCKLLKGDGGFRQWFYLSKLGEQWSHFTSYLLTAGHLEKDILRSRACPSVLSTSSWALAGPCLLPQGSVMSLDCETCKKKCSLRSKLNCRREKDIFKDEFKIANSIQTN